MSKEILNWSAISKLLNKNGHKTLIRSNKIPKKHKERVNQLLFYVESWVNNIELVEKDKKTTQLKDDFLTELDNLRAKLQDFD